MPRHPTQEQIETAMRARINAGQPVPAEYEHLKDFAHKPAALSPEEHEELKATAMHRATAHAAEAVRASREGNATGMKHSLARLRSTVTDLHRLHAHELHLQRQHEAAKPEHYAKARDHYSALAHQIEQAHAKKTVLPKIKHFE